MSSPVKVDWSKVDNPELILQRFSSRRSVVYGTKGIVSSSQPLATEAGLEILRKGGNAADAAVATSAALNVTEPSCCGIGGDAFCLFYDAKTKQVKALNGSGHSPEKLTIDYIRRRGIKGSQIPVTDLNAVTVPGAAAAWADTIEKFGSGNLSLAEVLDPAIRLAEEGVPVSEINSFSWQRSENLIKNASPNGDEMLLNGRAPLPGQIIKLTNLGKTFRELAAKGKDGFYKGRIAEAIVELIQSKGGVMELEDLAKHETKFVEPLKYTYAGEVNVYEVWILVHVDRLCAQPFIHESVLQMAKGLTSPPYSSRANFLCAGITALIALGILESAQEQGIIGSLSEMEHNSTEYLHILVEALRLAFADSQWYVADPDVVDVPVKDLLNKEYLASRARLIDPTKTNPRAVHGNPFNSSDTVYFSVTDRWGNACSYIQSNYAGFGTGAIPKGCGFTLQNRGSGFILDENHPNALKGGKRPYHTIIPCLATKGEGLFLSFGVMGGFMQPQGHVQVLLNILRGYTPQAALDAPRFCISAGSPETQSQSTGNAGDINSEVYFEEGIPDETIAKLREMGHDARKAVGFNRSMMGRGQVIQKIHDASGRTVWAAGSDPRADGHAAAQI
ncbi:lincomycin-condensing protein lmba [Moniliophthora roreri MCA 2997]|uniref:Lincomycin-condensing protein lmba n=1 Tax=Moniliophthora roreri (strain MCA 2997) TaxID=1381753 RepID=V2XZL1_MONRO|nr:lincomycin-condensing protein lmba [Moniliophthora roreri MCA 2997]